MQQVTGNPLMGLLRKMRFSIENQYPTECSSSVVRETLDTIVTKEKVIAKPPKTEQHLKTFKGIITKVHKPMFFG